MAVALSGRNPELAGALAPATTCVEVPWSAKWLTSATWVVRPEPLDVATSSTPRKLTDADAWAARLSVPAASAASVVLAVDCVDPQNGELAGGRRVLGHEIVRAHGGRSGCRHLAADPPGGREHGRADSDSRDGHPAHGFAAGRPGRHRSRRLARQPTRGQRRESGEQVRRRFRDDMACRRTPQHVTHASLLGDLGATGRAGREVRFGPGRLLRAEGSVDVGRGRVPEVSVHDPTTPVAGSRAPRRGRGAAAPSRSWLRPRWMRLRTVPSLTSRVAAISSYVSPSMSQSTTAARKSGGQRVERGLDVGVEVGVVVGPRRGRLAARQPVGGVLGERVEPDACLPADPVEEQVGRDPVQPALERARACSVEGAEHPDEDLLREVLGVVRLPVSR